MFHWEKMGRIFNPDDVTDRPWLKQFAQAPATLVFEKHVRVYFSCRPLPDENGQYSSYSGYVDLDRSDLRHIVSIGQKPILQLGDLGAFDEFGTYPVSVARDGDMVRAYYAGWTRCESVPFDVAIGMAVSRDGGVTFEKYGRGPVLSASLHEPFVLSGPKIRRYSGLWHLFYIAGRKWILSEGRPEPVYKIRMATSADGIHWHRHNRDLIESRVEADEAQASPDVFYHGGRYHMFFSYRFSSGFRGKEKGYRIGYAVSDDLIEWKRDDSKVGIDVSDSGWDSEMISYSHVFELDGEIYMLYLGNHVGKHGFGLAKLIGTL